MNLFAPLRLGDELGRAVYDAVTWLLTGGPASHDYDKPLDYTKPLCPASCDCGDCYHNPERNCHCFDGAEQLADREAEEEVWEPGEHAHHGHCAVPEPALTADELVAVRGLLQERYGDGWYDRDGGRCLFCGATREYVAENGWCVGPLCPHKLSNFAGAAASLAPDSSGPGVREDKQQDAPLGLGYAGTADPQQTSPASRGAGDRPAAEVGHPPVPPAAGPQTSQLLTKAANMIADITLGLHAYDEVFRLDFVAQLRDRAEAFTSIEDEEA